MFWEEKGEGGHCSHKREISQHKQNACTHTGLSNLPHSQQTKQTVKKKFLLNCVSIEWISKLYMHAVPTISLITKQFFFSNWNVYFNAWCMILSVVFLLKNSLVSHTYPSMIISKKQTYFLTLQPCFKLVKHWNKSKKLISTSIPIYVYNENRYRSKALYGPLNRWFICNKYHNTHQL